MQLLARNRRAFTLIEMVVVLAVMGIALAVAAPSMVLPSRTTDIVAVVADARSAALRRSEQMTLVIAPDGKWAIYPARSAADPLRSGRIEKPDGSSMRVDISPLGLCTVNETSAKMDDTLDPFSCMFKSAPSAAR